MEGVFSSMSSLWLTTGSHRCNMCGNCDTAECTSVTSNYYIDCRCEEFLTRPVMLQPHDLRSTCSLHGRTALTNSSQTIRHLCFAKDWKQETSQQ